ncbi:MAG: TIGR00730 family Rossman fold protein [Verrucomicrobiales bacterium]|nr:TIGR00730 family Rossman fold protein [Verrucomicrobiales bacterium]
MKRVAVFCGANRGREPAFAAAAQDLGATLARRGLGLVYGGGGVGLMGILADAVLAANGETIGVLPRALARKELAHPRVTDLRIVESMHARKALMAELADAFIAMPGGFGTLDESFEALTWFQLGIHRKPFGILNINGFFDHLLSFLRRGVHDELLQPEHLEDIVVDTDPGSLLHRLHHHQPRQVAKWISPAPNP